MNRSIYRIVQLEGLHEYKVQQFLPARTKWFGLRKLQAGWVDVAHHEYSGKSYIHSSMSSAEQHIRRLKEWELRAEANWKPVKSDL